jgi:hypothetical protein
MPKCAQHRLAKEISQAAWRVLINGQKAATVGCSKSDPTTTKGRLGSHHTEVPKPRELRQVKRHHRPAMVAVCLFRAGLIYGDGAITPSISVLSALERFNMATPAFELLFCLAQAASRMGKQLSVTVPMSRMVVIMLIASSGRPARHEAGVEQGTTRGESADDRSVLQ